MLHAYHNIQQLQAIDSQRIVFKHYFWCVGYRKHPYNPNHSFTRALNVCQSHLNEKKIDWVQTEHSRMLCERKKCRHPKFRRQTRSVANDVRYERLSRTTKMKASFGIVLQEMFTNEFPVQNAVQTELFSPRDRRSTTATEIKIWSPASRLSKLKHFLKCNGYQAR